MKNFCEALKGVCNDAVTERRHNGIADDPFIGMDTITIDTRRRTGLKQYYTTKDSI